MSTSIAKCYTDTVKKHFKVNYGVWEPGFEVNLGDYGVMRGNIFVRMGNIKELTNELKKFKIEVLNDSTSDSKFFTSEKGVKFELKPRVDLPDNVAPVNASLEISFSKENAVFFNLAGCAYESIGNKYQLGQKLLEIHRADKTKWKREFVLVTDRVVSQRSLMVVSTSSDFSMTFKADAKVPHIDLADASLGLSVARQNSTGYQFLSENGSTPLIGLSKIKRKFLRGVDFRTMMTMDNSMADAVNDYENSAKDDVEEDLMFAQFTDDLSE